MSIKRKVVEEEEDEEEFVATSSKRAKKQSAHEEPEEEDELEEDDDDFEAEETDDEMADEVEEELKASRSVVGNVAEMGVIEKVDMTNFMCHDRLTIPLIPQINFILGHNGSGKSAILTAITIALGGKASSTSRGNSLKTFVKEGKVGAIVELTLKNRGSEAFKPEVYGRSIIIERRINADGGGGWKIKSHTGHVVSTKREELSAICDHCNIQVDNPMNVLSQDNARQFLSSSRNSDKYAFFLRGTQLTQLAQEYEIVSANTEKMKLVVEKKREVLPDLEAQARDAVARWKSIQAVRQSRDRLEILRNQYIWAQVADKEDNLEDAVGKMAAIEVKLEKQHQQLKKALDQIAIQDEKIGQIEEQQNSAKEREEPLNDELARHKDEYKRANEKLRAVKQEEAQLNDQFRRQRDVIKDLQSRIDEEAERMSDGNRLKRQRIEEQMREAEQQRKGYERQQVELEEQLRAIDRQSRDGAPALQDAIRQRDEVRTRVSELETLGKRLQNTAGNRLIAFGNHVPQLVHAINKETRWKQKPIGPIGVHVKLKDMKWASVLESVIGNTLNAFCVTNHQDRQLLEELKRKTDNALIPVITGRDEQFSYEHGEPDENVLTILRVLDIDNDYVKRQLINAVHIEKSALVDRRADGDVLVRANPRVQSAFSRDGFKVSGGQRGSSTETLNPHKGPPRLSANVEAQLQQTRAEHQQAQQELQAINGQVQELDDERRRLDQQRSKLRRDLPTIRSKAAQCANREAKLADDMREDEPTNVAALEEAKEEAKGELDTIKAQFDAVQGRKVEIEDEIRPVREKVEAVRRQLHTFAEERQRAEPDLVAAAKDRLTAQQHMAHWKKEILNSDDKLKELTRVKEDAERAVNEFTASATEYCPERPDTSKPAAYYQREIEAIEKQLKVAERQQGQSVEAIMADVKATQQAFQNVKAELEGFKHAIKSLDNALETRLSKWHYFRRHIALRAKGQFNYNLGKRGYKGKLEFNHTEQKLRLRVQTDESQTAKKGDKRDKDPTSLSGGEKSFSTICLLLSLWEAIGCPIRCLDEFDVFMDAVNRKISMKMMIDTAKTSQGVQYVLITPQNMAAIPTGPEVRCHKLKDPERNQGTLAG